MRVCRARVGELLAYAALGHAHLLDRAIEEAGVEPPEVSLTAKTVISALEIPVKWVVRKLADAQDRRQVEAMYDELMTTGTVVDNLPEDDRQVAELYAREVREPRDGARREQRRQRLTAPPLAQGQFPKVAKPDRLAKLPMAATANEPEQAAPERKPETAEPDNLARLHDRAQVRQEVKPEIEAEAKPQDNARDEPATRPPRYYLANHDEVEAAPSIGPKTAARLEAIGIKTVQDLLDADATESANKLAVRHIKPQTITDWQHQARLVCTIPDLRGGHAQLLVGAGLTSLETIAEADPGEAMAAVLKFAQSSDGQRVLRDSPPPELDKIRAWVERAQSVRAAA